jgi:hypothetical protein
MVCTVPGGGTVTLSVTYQDDATTQTVTLPNSLSLGALGEHCWNLIAFEALTAGPIAFAAAVGGLSGSPLYSIYIAVEEL